MISSRRKKKDIIFHRISFKGVERLSKEKLKNKKNIITDSNHYISALSDKNNNISMKSTSINLFLKNMEDKHITKENKNILQVHKRQKSSNNILLFENQFKNLILQKYSKQNEQEKNDQTKEYPILLKIFLEKEIKKNSRNYNYNLNRCKTVYKKNYIKDLNNNEFEKTTKKDKKEIKTREKELSNKNIKNNDKMKEKRKIENTLFNKIKKKFLCCLL